MPKNTIKNNDTKNIDEGTYDKNYKRYALGRVLEDMYPSPRVH